MNQKILIVDDNQENLYMLRSLLNGHGYQVTEAMDGASALEQARATSPDAVVTDLMMPGMDGFALCRAWMQDDLLWRTPFIVYTATYTDPKDRRLVLDLGADAYIVKPSEPDELIQAVEEALERAKSKTDARPELYSGEFFERYANRLHEKLDRKIDQLADTRQRLIDYVTRCEAILDASPMAIVSIDGKRKIRAWNYAAERLFGYAESETLGRSLDMLVPKDRIDESKQRLIEASKTKGITRYETQRMHKDGHLLEVSISLTFLGPDIGHIGVISDLASLREATREKKELEEQLIHAQRMESVGRLSGGVAHDFNNLLTIILYYAESIENQIENGDLVREDAMRIRVAGEKAVSLTRRLLAFSRRQTMRLEVLDLNAVVGEMEKMLKRLIGEDIELQIDLADDLGRIEADASQLEQVIMNLAVNAKDAMRDGGRLLIETKNANVNREEAEAHPPLRPGRYVVMSVTDTGTGMDEETRARAFDPFFTTKEHGKGTGLGLAMVYGIVRQSKGFIWICSEPGIGTTFRIYLPRADKPLTSRISDKMPVEIRGVSERILVVEDDEMVRKLAARILEQGGYRTIEASNGRDALNLAKRDDMKIDLLLTDVVMPTMNGRELAKRILALQPAAKVVFTSGYTHDAIAHHGVLRPGVSLVDKPFLTATLMSAVRDVLDGKAPGGIGDDPDGTIFGFEPPLDQKR